MPCLFRYRWLKLPRAALPQGKGLSVYWARLAARAAFRKGVASYLWDPRNKGLDDDIWEHMLHKKRET